MPIYKDTDGRTLDPANEADMEIIMEIDDGLEMLDYLETKDWKIEDLFPSITQ